MPRKSSSLAPSSPAAGGSSSSSSSTTALPTALADPSLLFPKLIVFDLDYTLWPFWVDTHVAPPLRLNAQHSAATDRCGEAFAFYAEVPAVLQALPHLASHSSSSSSSSGASKGAAHRIRLGVASRTSAPGLARELLKGLHLPGGGGEKKPRSRRAIDAFDAGLEIYPGSKLRHFEALQRRTGIRYEDMLFFDDEARNRETERLGVTMRLVRDGVTWDEVAQGVEEWRRRRSSSPGKLAR